MMMQSKMLLLSIGLALCANADTSRNRGRRRLPKLGLAYPGDNISPTQVHREYRRRLVSVQERIRAIERQTNSCGPKPRTGTKRRRRPGNSKKVGARAPDLEQKHDDCKQQSIKKISKKHLKKHAQNLRWVLGRQRNDIRLPQKWNEKLFSEGMELGQGGFGKVSKFTCKGIDQSTANQAKVKSPSYKFHPTKNSEQKENDEIELKAGASVTVLQFKGDGGAKVKTEGGVIHDVTAEDWKEHFESLSANLSEETLAVKVIKKGVQRSRRRSFYLKEKAAVRLHQSLPHSPYFTRIRRSYNDKDGNLCVVSELRHGDLWTHMWEPEKSWPPLRTMLERSSYDEESLKGYGMCIIRAIQIMHYMNIAHCDLKDENLLMNTKTRYGEVTDFGWSCVLDEEATITGARGTPDYYTPEMAKYMLNIDEEPYGREADYWMLGVILYKILSNGWTPFRDKADRSENNTEIYHSILNDSINRERLLCSEAGKDFVAKLLTKNRQARLDFIKDMRNHPWIANADWDLLDSGRFMELPAGWKQQTRGGRVSYINEAKQSLQFRRPRITLTRAQRTEIQKARMAMLANLPFWTGNPLDRKTWKINNRVRTRKPTRAQIAKDVKKWTNVGGEWIQAS